MECWNPLLHHCSTPFWCQCEAEGAVNAALELPATIAEIWQRQITDERGFEAAYVAALPPVGVPARLNEQKQTELLTAGKWQPASRPVVEHGADTRKGTG